MNNKIIYRSCRLEDLQSVWNTFLISFRDMMRKVHGACTAERYPRAAAPYLRHILKTDSHSFWVAESGGRIAGFACAIVRGPIWFLSDFWILPQFQNRGIGKELLGRALQSERKFRIISTYSSLHPSAMRSYMMVGMTPRFPVFTLVARTESLKLDTSHAESVELVELSPTDPLGTIRKAIMEMTSVDRLVRGSGRDEDHDFFINRNGNRCWLARERRQTVGYSYLTPEGQIGPVATKSGRNMLFILFRAIQAGVRLHSHLSIRVPSLNLESMRALMRAGFQIESHALFMSSKEFGRMENYVISGPALF